MMPFSEYKTISASLRIFGITYHQDRFITAARRTPPENFRQEFEFDCKNLDVFSSEASRAELVILPLLKSVYRDFAGGFVLWVKAALPESAEISGTPDYMLAARSEFGIKVVGTPLVLIAEAKKNDFDQGWGQCLAELVTARRLNNDNSISLYGIVTDGERWQFGKLEQDQFTKNTDSFFIEDLPALFGAVHFVFQAACGQLEESAA